MPYGKTIIKATKNMHNAGKCFTKGHEYIVNRHVNYEAGLMEAETINDQGERHIIGTWWRNFKIIKS